MERVLEGKAAIVTGTNQGVGFEIAKKYLEAGASVAICARNKKLLEKAQRLLRPMAHAGQRVIARDTDVSKIGDVKKLVDFVKRELGHIDILVNNAGVYGPKGVIEKVDWREWARAININLHGSILMCRAVLPAFKARKTGKIIQLSGGGATNPLPRISAYAVSMAAIVRFVETLAEEVKEDGIDVNAIAPGALNTRLLDEVLDAGPEKVGQSFYERALKQNLSGGTPLEKGAQLAVFLGSSRSDGITGKLISAAWDPWSELPGHLDDLKGSDIYTRRRIVPKDRGKTWGNDQ